ncbi:Na/Pi cotransporter family protein [Desulfobacula phenolica]|uniref:Phosphate:Na+ symporter n=1 Tax=Desulfobacula phenolica TaxID=90732 RepID=A0A1H2EEQ6_9BACT|nr:Na/Pi symporter [Desulfobacula phenolica]SDT93218.1 phosphate:Na+ symporter [Desulfobacula phenolica]
MFDFDYWKLLAGLGIFLFGMQVLESSVKDLSGKAFRRIIRDYTNTRLKAIANGTLVTALLQSSSAVSLMVLAFVGAGIMSMENAFGIILGSNIGTTLTAWIVATLGFKIKIETFALPFIGIGSAGLILFKPDTRFYHINRLIIGFGFLFLGLDYMKTSVENFSQNFNPEQFQNLALWMCLVIGTVITALMQASAATIAITLTALNSQLMSFEMAAAMVIGANIGTTVTVLLGAIGATPPKKRVAASHLFFNIVTGIIAFLGLPAMTMIVQFFVDVSTNGPVGLALFHTIFNVTGVLIFLPFVHMMTTFLVRFFPERKAELSIHIANTPVEEVEAAVIALKNEIIHLLQECRLYTLRSLSIDKHLVFEEPLPFEKNNKKKMSVEDFYSSIKLLHSSIIAYYSQIQSHKLDEAVAQDIEKAILASRNIMNAAKNFKGIRSDFDEFESSDSAFLNHQYDRFRERLISLYHEINAVLYLNDSELQFNTIIDAFNKVELADNEFIQNTVQASSMDKKEQLDLSTLFLVNRLFTQACRMLIFGIKDLVLTQEKKVAFDKAVEP